MAKNQEKPVPTMSNSHSRPADQGETQAQNESRILLHHAPWSRSASVRWLLEELSAPYDINLVNIHASEPIHEAYRSIHPHKKVPAVEYRGQVLTERAAITIYLADEFVQAGLAPSLDDPSRAPYLRMLVYCDAVLDPCVAARAQKVEYAPSDYSFGAFEDMLRYLKEYLSEHPYAAGERFTAADTQLASSLGYTIHFLKAMPPEPEFLSYLERATDRAAHAKSQELDNRLMESIQSRAAQ